MLKKIYNILFIALIVFILLNINLKERIYNIKDLKLNAYNKNQVTFKSQPVNGVVEEDLICSIKDEEFKSISTFKNGYLDGTIRINTKQSGENIVIYKNITLNLKETTNNNTVGNIKIKTTSKTEVIEDSEYLIKEETLDINGIFDISLFELTKLLFLDAKSKLDLDMKQELINKIITSNIKQTTIVRNEVNEKLSNILKDRSFVEEYNYENKNKIGKYYKRDLDNNLLETCNYNDKGQLQGWKSLYKNNIIYDCSYYTYGYLVIKEEYDSFGNIVSKEEFINSQLNKITTYYSNGKIKDVIFKNGNAWKIYQD